MTATRPLAILSLTLLALPAFTQSPADLRPTAYAIKGATVVPEPGKSIPNATVVIRDGLVVAVGIDEKIPPDALVMDGKGMTVYAGFLDAGSPRGYDVALRRSQTGPPAVEDVAADPLAATKADNRKGLTPDFAVNTALKMDEEAVAPWRRVGFTSHLIVPTGGYLSGTSALVSLSGEVPRDATLKAPVALHAQFGRVQGQEYPTALMGTVAHVRQTLLDAGWLKRKWDTFEKNGRVGKRPAADPGLEALWPVLDGKVPVMFEADTADQIHRALDLAAEFKLKPVIVGGKSAWKVTDRLKAEGVPVVLGFNFTPASVREADLAVRVREDRERLRKEDYACAAKLHKAGVSFCVMTTGLTGNRPHETFRENLRKAIDAGLPADAALAALTTDAAKILGVSSQVGTVAKGKPAHLVLCDGPFHEARTKYKFAFADGVRFDLDESRIAPAGATAAAPTPGGPGGPAGPGRGGRRGNQPPADATPPATTTTAQAPAPGGRGGRGGFGGGPGGAGAASALPFSGDAFRALIPMLDAVDLSQTEIEADRKPGIQTGGNVLLKNATVLTGTGTTLTTTDVFVKAGKIAAIGPGLGAGDAKVIDCTGLFVMAGIIDTHSHFAVSGGVNEASLSVVPEVRVRDVIDSEDVQIYRALGGGVTTARLLHGSANCIGGQDAVVKMKYGRPAKEMLVDSPRGVKFALGENVKRSDGRFPNSRLGVEAVMVRSFTEAKAYAKRWADYEKAKGTPEALPEPRRDLRLEALADVLSGDLRIHSHCYRADEILMLLRVADTFDVKVRSLQHVLEGYKVAPEIARHGASVSIFSDWWAYKIEAFDAIPYGAKLLQDAGVMVCLKSDDNELMRHLNQEAAKLVKYCGFSPEEALHTITLNPAKQLAIDKRVGTVEVGKDADLAVFSGHPLNSYARCEYTFVEGELYFQRSKDHTAVVAAKAEPTKPIEPFPALSENPAGAYVLSGGTIHTPGRAPFVGSVVVTGKSITFVGPTDQVKKPAGAKVIDVTGKRLYPGLIDAGTVLGLVEIDSLRETNDSRDGGELQPDLKASIGVNPDSELIPVTRANGVTTVVTRPTGSLMPGQASLLNLSGWTPADMSVVDPLALHIEYPGEPAFGRGFGFGPPALETDNAAARFRREEKLAKLKDLFDAARRYDDAKKAVANPAVNIRLEAVVPYARGERPVIFTADKRADVLGAVKLAEELKVKPIVSGASEAWKVAPELARKNVPVILGPVMSIARETGDRYDASYAAAGVLHRAGVNLAIRSAGSNNTRNLPYEAAMAVAYGLPPEEGLKAVTLGPAEIMGVADKLGSLDEGKRANLVITNGDILQASTQVLSVFIDGKPHEPTSKQTRLYDKYRKRLTEVQSGPTPATKP